MTSADPNPSTTSTEVCIVGGGPAGLALAQRLAEHRLDVVVLESGPPEKQAADLNRAEVTGDPIHALDPVGTRFRQLGGNANQWSVKLGQHDGDWTFGVRYGTLTDQALGDRPWIDGSGWPIDGAELDRWNRQAHELLGQGDFDYDEAGDDAGQIEWLGDDVVNPRGFRFGPRDRLLVQIKATVQTDPRIRVVEGANVTRLHQESSSKPITGLTYADENGRSHELRADTVVLAGGGIENARLLLASERERGGVGNENDNVGRYFMDHPLYSIGDILPEDPESLRDFTFFDLVDHDGGLRHGHVVTAKPWCEANRSVEIAAALFPRPARAIVESVDNMKYLRANPKYYGSNPGELARALRKIPPGIRGLPWALNMMLVKKQSLLPGFGRGGWSQDPTGLGFSELEVVLQCEQTPLRDSRVTLSDAVDRFGTPIPRVHWLLGDQTRASVLAFQQLIAERVEKADIGSYRPRAGNLDELLTPTSIAHHLGTTRMSVSPSDGVVDADCRVHTCPNLYVVGSSVFPVGGYVNPTLTIVALALRLGDTLAAEHRARP